MMSVLIQGELLAMKPIVFQDSFYDRSDYIFMNNWNEQLNFGVSVKK